MKSKTKLPLVFAVLATGPLTGFAPIAAPAHAALEQGDPLADFGQVCQKRALLVVGPAPGFRPAP